MKKYFITLLTVLLIFSLISCKKDEEPNKETPEGQFDKDSVKILAVGNSFTANAVTYLYSILEGFSVKEIIIGNMYIGATDLNDHRYYAEHQLTTYLYRKNNSNLESKGMFVEKNYISLDYAVNNEEWDLIVFPSVRSLSCIYEDRYNEDDINYLLDYFEQSCPNIPIYWYMTWAYQSDYVNEPFATIDCDQLRMYEIMTSIVQKKIVPNDRFEKILPVGTAVQNARTSYIGDNFTKDGYHLNPTGEYLAGLTWVLGITGWSINDFDTASVPVTLRNHFHVLYESAINALNNPFKITESNYKEK